MTTIPCPHCRRVVPLVLVKDGICPNCLADIRRTPVEPPPGISLEQSPKRNVKPPPFVPTAATPRPQRDSQERVLERDAITAGELRAFLLPLPERKVARRYPDGGSDTIARRDLYAALSLLAKESLIHNSTNTFVLTTARSMNGWACLDYGCAFELLEGEILQFEHRVSAISDARLIVTCLRSIESRIELGIMRDELHRQIADNWLAVKDFSSCYSPQYPRFASLVTGAFENYRTSLTWWNQGPGNIPLQFYGGGFGLSGAAKGMAVGLGLQTLVNSFNKHKQSQLNVQLQSEWWYASRKIRILERVMQVAT